MEERLARLEARLQMFEDERVIHRVVASYGPLVDTGAADDVAALWSLDGVYDVDGLYMSGRDDIAAMVRSSTHQGFIDGGCAHFQGPVHASIYGDHATAVSYSLLILHKQNEFEVERATAHHWQFERVESEWKVRKRTSRALNGDGYARKLLAGGVKKSAESETDSEQSTPQP